MSLRIGLAQPATSFGPDRHERNVESARRYAEAAAEGGVELLCFPETFPGEWRAPIAWTPEEAMADIARDSGLHVVFGFAEPLDPDGSRCFNTLALVGPDGETIGRYRRTSPDHAPWIYRGGKWWDFDWVPATELPVFAVGDVRVGLLMCSEVYVPELARILALKGADLICAPAGLIGPGSRLYATWRNLVWSRAIENLVYTAVVANVPSGAPGGLAMVCSPESILLESAEEGLFTADLDLDRLAWLREQQDGAVETDTPWATKPGLLRDWRRRAVLDAASNDERHLAPPSPASAPHVSA